MLTRFRTKSSTAYKAPRKRRERTTTTEAGADGGITLTPSDALACSTYEGEGTYCASLTVAVPHCWSGTLSIQIGDLVLNVNTYDGDGNGNDCDGEITIESICGIPYSYWVNFCW